MNFQRQTAVVPIDGVPQQETVKLSLIIERAIQTAYHELMVLTELLPRKPDVERKVKWIFSAILPQCIMHVPIKKFYAIT